MPILVLSTSKKRCLKYRRQVEKRIKILCNFAEKFFVLMLDARGAGIRHTFKLVSAMQLVKKLHS